MKHTQGEWKIARNMNGALCIYTGEDEYLMETLISKVMGTNIPDQFKANAKLIAAAPDLLEAAKNILHDAINHQHRNNSNDFPKRKEAIEALEAAIKKATE